MIRAHLYKKTTAINIYIIDIFQKNIDKWYEKMFDIPITRANVKETLKNLKSESWNTSKYYVTNLWMWSSWWGVSEGYLSIDTFAKVRYLFSLILPITRLYIEDFCGPKRPVYRQRKIPNSRVFSAVHNRISESGSIFTITRERGASNYYNDKDEVELEEQIIALGTVNPRISTCDLSCRTDCIRWFVWRLLSDKVLHLYHFTKVQQLPHEDFGRWENFCELLLRNRELNRYILWTNKSSHYCFYRLSRKIQCECLGRYAQSSFHQTVHFWPVD